MCTAWIDDNAFLYNMLGFWSVYNFLSQMRWGFEAFVCRALPTTTEALKYVFCTASKGSAKVWEPRMKPTRNGTSIKTCLVVQLIHFTMSCPCRGSSWNVCVTWLEAWELKRSLTSTGFLISSPVVEVGRDQSWFASVGCTPRPRDRSLVTIEKNGFIDIFEYRHWKHEAFMNNYT